MTSRRVHENTLEWRKQDALESSTRAQRDAARRREELVARPEEATCAHCGLVGPVKYAMETAWCADCFPEAAGEWDEKGGKHRPARDAHLDLGNVARALAEK